MIVRIQNTMLGRSMRAWSHETAKGKRARGIMCKVSRRLRNVGLSASFTAWDSRVRLLQQRQVTISRILRWTTHKRVLSAWYTWQDFVVHARHVKSVTTRVLNRLRHRDYFVFFTMWRKFMNTQRGLRHVIGQMQNALLGRAFSFWEDRANNYAALRVMAQKLARRIQNITSASAFRAWLSHVDIVRQQAADAARETSWEQDRLALMDEASVANNGALASAGRRLSEFSATIDTERALRQQAEARAQAEADAKSECSVQREEALRQLASVEDEAASKARAVIADYKMRTAAAVTIQHDFHRMRSRRDYRAWLAAHRSKLGVEYSLRKAAELRLQAEAAAKETLAGKLDYVFESVATNFRNQRSKWLCSSAMGVWTRATASRRRLRSVAQTLARRIRDRTTAAMFGAWRLHMDTCRQHAADIARKALQEQDRLTMMAAAGGLQDEFVQQRIDTTRDSIATERRLRKNAEHRADTEAKAKAVCLARLEEVLRKLAALENMSLTRDLAAIDTERALRQQAEARAQAEADAKSECLARLEEALRQLASVEDEAASKARAVIADHKMRTAAAVTIQHGFHRMRSRRDYRAWLAAHQYKLGQFPEVTRTAAATAAAKGSNVTVATQTIPPPRTPMVTARRLDGPSKRNVTDAVAASSGAVRAALAASASTGHEDQLSFELCALGSFPGETTFRDPVAGAITAAVEGALQNTTRTANPHVGVGSDGGMVSAVAAALAETREAAMALRLNSLKVDRQSRGAAALMVGTGSSQKGSPVARLEPSGSNGEHVEGVLAQAERRSVTAISHRLRALDQAVAQSSSFDLGTPVDVGELRELREELFNLREAARRRYLQRALCVFELGQQRRQLTAILMQWMHWCICGHSRHFKSKVGPTIRRKRSSPTSIRGVGR
jgi:hypothetical protein